MGFSATLRPHLPATSHLRRSEELLSRRFGLSGSRLVSKSSANIKTTSFRIVKSVLNSSRLSINDNGANESTRVLLERLFAQTQWIGEPKNGDSGLTKEVNLEVLESDLVGVLKALKKKEEDLQNAERKVLSENQELERARNELARRERDIADSFLKHEKLEKELKEANFNLANQARQIEELKLLINERDREISAAQSALTLKKDDLGKLGNVLVKKTEEAAKVDLELKDKGRVLDEVNKVVSKQRSEIQELRQAIQEKEEELAISESARKQEEEKVKAAKASLEKQTMQWLLAQEELKKLAEQAAKQMGETNDTLEDFKRVKNLLVDVRSELVSSRKSLAYSRKQMEEQEHLFKMQLVELEEQRNSVVSYMNSLTNAQVEVGSERVKLRVAEARNKDLERYLSMEKELVEELREDLNKEKYSLKQATQEMSFLKQELEKKTSEFEKMHGLLQTKEAELVENKLEIQHLKSEQASLQLVLEERDLELSNARKKLEEVNLEVTELKMLMKDKEDQLIQATTRLKEKDEHVQIMQDELNESKVKMSEAETVVERIVELTNKLVVSIKNEDYDGLREYGSTIGYEFVQPLEKPSDNFRFEKKRLETELNLTRGSLRAKEMEVLAAQRALRIKDEELETVITKLDAREKELNRLKQEMIEDANDLRKLYGLAQERIGERSTGDLAIEKLQLEAAQLEVEAATSALHKLAALSRELLSKASLSIEGDAELTVLLQNGSDHGMNVFENNECFKQVSMEVTQLSSLAKQLVKEAGIAAGEG